MSDYIETTSKNREVIDNNIYRIQKLANSFDNIGQSQTADILFHICKSLSKANKNISDAIGKDIHDQCIQSQKSCDDLFKTVIESTFNQIEDIVKEK